MRRLRELEARTPLLAEVRRLVESVDALPESEARMLRVRRALDRPRGMRAFVRRLPTLAFSAALLLFGASAFAAYRFVAAVVTAKSSTGTSAAVPAVEHGQKSRGMGAAGGRQAPTTTTTTATTTITNTITTEDAGAAANPNARAGLHAAMPRATQAPVAQAKPAREAAAQSDSELVHRAAVALRRDHAAARAARLLDQHRARYPEGPLSEEALALRIEAAIALREARAAALAREYQARYPRGRYLSVAQRAFAGNAQ